MILLNLPPFNPVANGVRSTTSVPRYALTLGKVQLKFKGTNSITKATITEIVVKIGARVIFGPISGTELDRLNRFKKIFDQADTLTIDFTMPGMKSMIEQEIGGIDIPAIGEEDIFIEVVNNASSGTPALFALGGFTSLQFDPERPKPEGQWVKKVIAYQIPSSGGNRLTWTPDFKGAQVQAIHFAYTGTDWTSTADGNLRTVECRKNGTAIWDRIACTDNRFYLNENGRAPQTRMYSLDFIADGNFGAMLDTRDARALEFNLELGAADTIRALVEVLDIPRNL